MGGRSGGSSAPGGACARRLVHDKRARALGRGAWASPSPSGRRSSAARSSRRSRPARSASDSAGRAEAVGDGQARPLSGPEGPRDVPSGVRRPARAVAEHVAPRGPNCTLIPLTGARVSVVSTTSEVSRPSTAGFDIRTFSAGSAGVVPVPGVVPGFVPGSVPAAHRDRVTVLSINVTAPLRARSLPSTVTPSFTEIDVSARMLPWNAVARPERRGAAHLPEDVARLGAVDEADAAVGRRDERRLDLEDEHRARVALRVERQVSRSARARRPTRSCRRRR